MFITDIHFFVFRHGDENVTYDIETVLMKDNYRLTYATLAVNEENKN